MRKRLQMSSFLVLSASFLFAQDNPPKDFAFYWRQATQAYQAKNYPAYFENMKGVLQFRPDNPNMRYNFAGANALVGNKSEALQLLTKLADMGLIYDAAVDEDFSSIKEMEEFKTILNQFNRNKTPVNHSEVAFKLSEKDLITESVAYDPKNETFYISSVHKRKIVSFDKHGMAKDFATEKDGLWSVFGMKVDAKRRRLWVCSSVMPEMLGYQKTDDGRAGVFQFFLSRDLTRIARAEIIEANNPLFNEPTLGVIVQDRFYYVANSQWSSFNTDKTIFPLEKLQAPIIMQALLK